MIDLILQAPNKATLVTFLKARNLIDPDLTPVKGFEYCLWADSGKMMIKLATFDQDGNELTPAGYEPGVILIVRLSADLFVSDRRQPDVGEDETEQYARSKLVRWLKNNGTIGTSGGIRYIEVEGVRLYRPEDVATFLQSRGMPGHEWLGGNEY